MDKREEIMRVICCAMPNGGVLWFESKKGKDYLDKVISSWKEQHPEFEDTDCSMGFVEIKMPVDKYLSISSTNNFNWPEGE